MSARANSIEQKYLALTGNTQTGSLLERGNRKGFTGFLTEKSCRSKFLKKFGWWIIFE
jgi:hypothetical protein